MAHQQPSSSLQNLHLRTCLCVLSLKKQLSRWVWRISTRVNSWTPVPAVQVNCVRPMHVCSEARAIQGCLPVPAVAPCHAKPVRVLCALQTTRKAPGCLANRVSGDGRNTRACDGPISIATLLEVVDAILNDKPVDLESIEVLQQMLVRGEIVEQVMRLEADRYVIQPAILCLRFP